MIKLLTVFALGAVELWAAVPAGFVLGVHPALIAIATSVGAMLSMLFLALVGQRMRAWLARRHSGKGKNSQHGRIYRIWSRYGVAGLGLLAPLLVGVPIGTAIGVTLGAPTGQLLFWMSIGIALWSTVLTLVLTLGLVGIEALMY